MNTITVQVVPDQACPECGAYWGHPDRKLDWPNRAKVENNIKCYNPECRVYFYHDGLVTDLADKCKICDKYLKVPAQSHDCLVIAIHSAQMT